MAQARNSLNPVLKFSVLRYAGQYSPLFSCPMTWSTVQVFRMDSLYLLVYNIQNNKSVLQLVFPVFHLSFVILLLVSPFVSVHVLAFLETQWCLLLISMHFTVRKDEFLPKNFSRLKWQLPFSVLQDCSLFTFLSQEKRKDLSVTGN